MRIKKNVNFGMNEVINSESATQTIADFAGKTVTLSGILFAEKDEETGIKTVVVMKTDAGLITSISPTVINSLETLVGAYEEFGKLADLEAGIKVTVNAQQSASKRTFYTILVA